MLMTILGLLGGIKALLVAVGGAFGLIYIWWLKRGRDKAKAENEQWRRVDEVRKNDIKVDDAIRQEIDKVDAAPDDSLDAELDRVRQHAKDRNAASR